MTGETAARRETSGRFSFGHSGKSPSSALTRAALPAICDGEGGTSATATGESSASVSPKADRRLNRRFDKLEQALPDPVSNRLNWLRRPHARWLRIPLGLLFILGGVFSFLPVLGLWMLPLGLLLLAIDLPFLKGPVSRAMVWGERKWQTWRRRRRSDPHSGTPA